MNLSLLPSQSFSRLGPLYFVRQPLKEKENLEFKPAVLCLRIDFISHPINLSINLSLFDVGFFV